MAESVVDISRDFFFEVLKPILDREFRPVVEQTAFGVFGYGSEVLGLDDSYSSDHHWGLRINALLPDYLFNSQREEVLRVVAANLPDSYRGHSLSEGYAGGTGLSLMSLEEFLRQTVGIDFPPETYEDWLQAPEEDIIHVINGEVWLDEAGCFSAIRRQFLNYYPEPVRLRRIAHWCRYFSGMGTYALQRALLRDNEYFASVAFGKTLRWGVQLAFMLDKRYYPYDKWVMAFLPRLPRLGPVVTPLVQEAASLSSPWQRKLVLLNELADVLDSTMVADGIIRPHPRYRGSPSSGYRLLEHAYAEILQNLPAEIRSIVPVWDQVYLERMHSTYVAGLDLRDWDAILNLNPVEDSA
jgi:hypothetical protein